jgi:hypothetical protein
MTQGRRVRTLDISHALVEDLLEDLGVFQVLLDLGDDGLGELALLSLLDALLVADPRVQYGLGFGGKGSLLLQLVCLSLESGSLLQIHQYPIRTSPINIESVPLTPRKESW